MTTKRYKLVSLVYDFRSYTESDEVWASLPEPQILWLIKQDPTRYVIDQTLEYTYDNPGPMRAEVYVIFNDERLETEFLLKFGDLIRKGCGT